MISNGQTTYVPAIGFEFIFREKKMNFKQCSNNTQSVATIVTLTIGPCLPGKRSRLARIIRMFG